MHGGSAVNEVSGKPEIIMTYNSTKGSDNTFDQICQSANCSRKTKRWPTFMIKLHKELCKELQRQRLSQPNSSRELRGSITKVLGLDQIRREVVPQQGQRKYCNCFDWKKKRIANKQRALTVAPQFGRYPVESLRTPACQLESSRLLFDRQNSGRPDVHCLPQNQRRLLTRAQSTRSLP
ncbi:hypothetical protein J6590_087078 [Homalodisca vitripennis]|nr:hypothetical protein J6590_087078 [Homalodisca vitripennis]